MKPMAGSERSGAGSPGTGANASSKVMAPTRSTVSGGATGGTAVGGGLVRRTVAESVRRTVLSG